MSNLQACANDSEAASIPSAAIREGVILTKSTSTQPAALTEAPRQLRQRRLADVFRPSRNPGEKLTDPRISHQGRDGFDARIAPTALISIGPNTDAALDQLKLGDEILPKLRMLVSTVRSSRWEAVFRSPKWDLNYEHASLLAKALLTDLQGFTLNPDAVKVSDLFMRSSPY